MTTPFPAAPDLTPLTVGAAKLDIRLSPNQCSQFAAFMGLLIDWNERINLTSITEPREIQIRHFLDSLTVVDALAPGVRAGEQPATLLDVGAGAGFPGIPLAIVLPRVAVALLEATQKKCRFLEYVVHDLGLPNVDVHCGRAEELGHRDDLREAFDVVVARAVAPLATLAELCLPFARVGGRFIAQKTRGIDAEIRAAQRAIPLLGGQMVRPIDIVLPIADEPRLLVVIEKVRPTPAPYPRRPGVPAKSPL
jgi:16S rRNA (guanine527-N7)-methyltransferase